MADRRSGGGFRAFALGFIFAVVLLIAGAWAYLHFGHPSAAARALAGRFAPRAQNAEGGPPAVSLSRRAAAVSLPAAAAPARRQTAHPRSYPEPPFGASEDGFEEAAQRYRSGCAACHGLPGQDSTLNQTPPAPQLWKRHPGSAAVGVSAQPVGEIEQRMTEGVAHSAMAQTGPQLTQVERWQIALLLKNAGQPLPEPVLKLLQTSR